MPAAVRTASVSHPQAIEDHSKFVDDGDVQIALGVFDDLGRFGDLDARRLMRAGLDDLAIEFVDEVGDFRGRAGGDFHDIGQAALLVAGIDALRAVAGEEVDIELKTGNLLQHRDAVFLGCAGIDGRFVDDDVALLQHLADRRRRADQPAKIGALMVVDRRRHCNDVDVATGQIVDIGRIFQLSGFGKLFAAELARLVMALSEHGDPAFVDVEADNRAIF